MTLFTASSLSGYDIIKVTITASNLYNPDRDYFEVINGSRSYWFGSGGNDTLSNSNPCSVWFLRTPNSADQSPGAYFSRISEGSFYNNNDVGFPADDDFDLYMDDNGASDVRVTLNIEFEGLI